MFKLKEMHSEKDHPVLTLQGAASHSSQCGDITLRGYRHTYTRAHKHISDFSSFFPLLTLEVVGFIPPKVHNEETLTNCQHLEHIFSWQWANKYLYSEWGKRSYLCHA